MPTELWDRPKKCEEPLTPLRPTMAELSLGELRAELARVIASEDTLGRPDIHTEDYLRELIARKE